MGRVADNSALKRKRPDRQAPTQNLSDVDRLVYEAILSRKDMGVFKGQVKAETKLPDLVITKSIKSLQAKNKIKEVINVQANRKKCLMAVEFEPSNELTGGMWYAEGQLDTEFIQLLKRQCIMHINKLKVATIEGISESIRKSGVFKIECSIQQIAEIVRSLVLDNEVVELNTQTGDSSHIPIGSKCYSLNKGGAMETGAMASIPCGVCPRLNDCTPDGIISPKTCVYYTKWLDF